MLSRLALATLMLGFNALASAVTSAPDGIRLEARGPILPETDVQRGWRRDCYTGLRAQDDILTRREIMDRCKLMIKMHERLFSNAPRDGREAVAVCRATTRDLGLSAVGAAARCGAVLRLLGLSIAQSDFVRTAAR